MSVDLCNINAGNTGGPACVKQRGVPKKFAVGSRSFTSAEYTNSETMRDAIIASLLLETNDADKLYVFPEIFQVDPTTEANTEGNLTLGPKLRLRKGRPSYTYTVDISHDEYQKLLVFDGRKIPVFTLDDESAFWGFRPATTANTINTKDFSGEIAYITISGNGFKDGANVATGKCTITVSYLSVDDFEKRSAYVSVPTLSPGDLVGLIDVMMSLVSLVSNVATIQFTIPVPQVDAVLNFGEDYITELDALSFTAATGTTYSTPLAITTQIASGNNMVITFDTTAFTALSSGTKIQLKGPSVSAMSVGNIGTDTLKYEIKSIIITKP